MIRTGDPEARSTTRQAERATEDKQTEQTEKTFMNVGVYARRSTEQQNGLADESKSVTRQMEHARAYATRKGWTIADDRPERRTSSALVGDARLPDPGAVVLDALDAHCRMPPSASSSSVTCRSVDLRV